jgi:eukaryotic-like serine/threonine-protein kinase
MAVMDKDLWQRLSPLLDELLEEEAPRRDERLRQLRAEDHALAERVEALLAREAVVETDHFLEQSPIRTADGGTLAGHVVGHYTLLEPIGRGGMGSVWLARRNDGRYDGNAAVKFLNLALLARGGAERFRREGQALARLSHPHITRLLDAGVSGSQPYLVLEYIDGQPIDRWCDEQRLDVTARLTLLLAVMDAVSHAHGRLILHRDLKPPNILVTADGEVKLLDFGIAKLLQDDEASDASELTAAGVAYTPDYAAPEQLHRDEVTTASDVYALGVLTHVLLTGTHPTAEGATGARRMHALQEREPTLASEAARRGAANERALARGATPSQLARRFRGDLDNILLKAMAKQPQLRYASVQALADDVRRHLRHEPVSARGNAIGYRAARFVRRHRLAVGAAAVTLVSLLGGIIGTTWQAVEARRQRAEAEAQARRSETARRLLKLMITEVGDASRPVTPLELLGRGVTLLDAQQRDPRLLGTQLIEIADNYLELDQPEQARTLLLRVDELARSANDSVLRADAQCDLSYLELRRNDREAARQRLDEAERLLSSAVRPSPVQWAGCQRMRANLLAAEGNVREALALGREAVRLLESAGLQDHPMRSSILTFVSDMHHQLHEYVPAFEANRQAGEQMDRDGRGGSAARLTVMNNEAVDLANFGEYAQAARVLTDILARVDARGPSAPRFGYDANYAAALTNIGRTDEALQVLERARALAIEKKNTAAEIRARFYRARALLRAGRMEDALVELDAVETAYRQDPDAHGSPLLAVALTRADWLLHNQRVAEAREVIDALLGQIDREPSHGPLAAALILGAEIALADGNVGLAETRAKRAVDRTSRAARDSTRSAEVGKAQLIRARVHQVRGEREAAQSAYRAAEASLSAGLGADHALTREARAGTSARGATT